MQKSPTSVFNKHDLWLFGQNNHEYMYEKLGAHRMQRGGTSGYHFAVWAPNAQRVSVVGSFNRWDEASHPMHRAGSSGIWETFVPNLVPGETYKYALVDYNGHRRLKADPYARSGEYDKGHASILCAPLSRYVWHDADWMAKRTRQNPYEQPLSVYEVHIDSWKRNDDNKPLSYRELAHELADYVQQTGFTHVEFMPVTEHPLTASWGYQVTGFFAPSSRYGTPQDFQYLVDTLHRANVGVLLDWVPGHFPKDDFGLARFDGTALYEHLDPRLGEQPDWGTYIFNFGRNEVRNFLINSALFWADKFHADGLRVDAVSSMLYLDFSRKDGEWIPNRYGGKENLEAIDFLRTVNDRLHRRFPGFITVAEESSSFGRVSQPTAVGGLGFDYKWNMGWMHDTLSYCRRDPISRRYHHHQMTFAMLYQYSEHFINALSHDEVVYGKCSLLRQTGSFYAADKFATLRALYGFMWGWPGKKMLFMGDEFAQWDEWDFHKALDWFLLQRPGHAGMQRLVSDLNRLYRSHPVWYRSDMESGGFFWINPDDADHSVFSFIRKDHRQCTATDCLSEALQPQQPFSPNECLWSVCRALGQTTDGATADGSSGNAIASVEASDRSGLTSDFHGDRSSDIPKGHISTSAVSSAFSLPETMRSSSEIAATRCQTCENSNRTVSDCRANIAHPECGDPDRCRFLSEATAIVASSEATRNADLQNTENTEMQSEQTRVTVAPVASMPSEFLKPSSVDTKYTHANGITSDGSYEGPMPNLEDKVSGSATAAASFAATADVELKSDTADTEPIGEPLLFISNFTPVERSHYKCGVPSGGIWREIFNSDAHIYGGQNRGNYGTVRALAEPHDNQPFTLDLCLPPLSTLILEHVSEAKGLIDQDNA